MIHFYPGLMSIVYKKIIKINSALFLWRKNKNILNSAVQNGAKVIKGNGAYWFIMLQPVNEASAQTVLINELIG